MRRIARLSNPVMGYDWGSRTALAELLGRQSPSLQPEAELWMGAHPRSPSRIDGEQGPTLLDLIAGAPGEILGSRVQRRFRELPFVLKVLAVERPLSLQAHPDAPSARRGFERENAAGIRLDARERSFSDPHHKPELLCALRPFSALCGFRRPAGIDADLARLGHGEASPLRRALARGPESERLRAFLSGLLHMESGRREELVQQTVRRAAERAGGDAALGWLLRLQQEHPGDPGVLAPLFLNLVRLQPGEAFYMGPGELHCYLEGLGVEIMASSDNVLRGGLTHKHVAVDGLLELLEFRPWRGEIRGPRPGPVGEVYTTPAQEFELSRLRLEAGTPLCVPEPRGVEILLCTEGQARLSGEAGAAALELLRGQSCLVPAAVGSYRIRGEGTLYRASVPH